MCVLLSNLYLYTNKVEATCRYGAFKTHKGNYSRCEIYVVKHKKANARLFYLSFQ